MVSFILLGINKANYYLDRKMVLTVNIGNGIVERSLTVLLESKANPVLGDKGRYKTYLRLVGPIDSNFADISILSSLGETKVKPQVDYLNGRVEAGALVNINPGQAKTVTFNWKTKTDLLLNRNGEYRIYWRKQAGTTNDDIKVNISFVGSKVQYPLGFILTDKGTLNYNTTLFKDF